jgi:hypothetical protein
MNPEGKFVEDTSRPWTSSYSHQKRPDQGLRLKAVLPTDRLVHKKGRQFTTDTSREHRLAEIERLEQAKKQIGRSPIKNSSTVTVYNDRNNNVVNPETQIVTSNKKKFLPINYSKK